MLDRLGFAPDDEEQEDTGFDEAAVEVENEKLQYDLDDDEEEEDEDEFVRRARVSEPERTRDVDETPADVESTDTPEQELPEIKDISEEPPIQEPVVAPAVKAPRKSPSPRR